MAGISETRQWDSLLTTTAAKYRNTLIDNVFDEYPLLSFLNGKLGSGLRGKSIKEVEEGGETIVEQILYEMNSTVDSFSNYGPIDTTPQEGMTIARFNWKQYAGTVSISGHERRVNRGSPKMISLLDSKFKQLEMSLRDRLSRDAFGDGTGNGSMNLTGLAAHISATATLGGLAPGTFPWWAASVTASVGSFATNGIKNVRTKFNTLSLGNDRPDAIFSDQTTYERYDAAVEDKQRYHMTGTINKVADAGFVSLAWQGVPWLFDRDCTANAILFLNSRYLKFKVLKGADFEMTPFVTPTEQDASSAKMLFEGNLVTNNRRRLGSLTGISD